jgi:copper chaperone
MWRNRATNTPGGYTDVSKEEQMETKTYSVPDMTCGHCRAAVTHELESLGGVEAVDVNLETKLVTVRGNALDDAALIAAIDEAGYDAEPVAAR